MRESQSTLQYMMAILSKENHLFVGHQLHEPHCFLKINDKDKSRWQLIEAQRKVDCINR